MWLIQVLLSGKCHSLPWAWPAEQMVPPAPLILDKRTPSSRGNTFLVFHKDSAAVSSVRSFLHDASEKQHLAGSSSDILLSNWALRAGKCQLSRLSCCCSVRSNI